MEVSELENGMFGFSRPLVGWAGLGLAWIGFFTQNYFPPTDYGLAWYRCKVRNSSLRRKGNIVSVFFLLLLFFAGGKGGRGLIAYGLWC